MTVTKYPHIETSENGTLYVAGTRCKVKVLILEHIAWGMGASEIRDGHPGLTLGDVHAVLAYFYDNEEAIRTELDEDLRESDELCRRVGTTINRQELIDRLNAAESAKVPP
jgi:uncharacterized protein (DUF433 family)